jgi:hypothetical protein
MRRQEKTRWAAVLAGAAVVAAVAGTVAAQARTGAKGRPDPVVQAVATLPQCPKDGTTTPSICIFSGPNATGTQLDFPTSGYHSQWINFDSVNNGNGFHPNSLIDNSGSDIWVYDAGGGKVAGPYCILGTSQRVYNTGTDWVPVNGGTAPPPPTPSPDYTPQAYQPGWFFIQYNVNACTTPPPTPLPSA